MLLFGTGAVRVALIVDQPSCVVAQKALRTSKLQKTISGLAPGSSASTTAPSGVVPTATGLLVQGLAARIWTPPGCRARRRSQRSQRIKCGRISGLFVEGFSPPGQDGHSRTAGQSRCRLQEPGLLSA